MKRRDRRRRNTLVIMAKQPALGRVKTRLARDIGAVEALNFYRTTLARTVRYLAADRRWRTLLAWTPDRAIVWPGFAATPRLGQGRGDLGERMQRLFDETPGGALIIIGADIPGIRRSIIADAFSKLAGHEVVLGPAEDGGYWLIGQQRGRRVLRPFDKVRWSSPHALQDTLANLTSHRVAFTDQLRDIDRGADLDAWDRAAGP